jgi:ElaA protein
MGNFLADEPAQTPDAPRLDWRFAAFDELSARDVHDLLKLRQNVFVIEQACLFPEIDGLDPAARHLLGFADGVLVVCARLLPAGQKMRARSIGRVASDPAWRGRSLGRAVMTQALARLFAEDPAAPVDLSAQAHLADGFYASLGFQPFGDPYVEDGIPHLDMRLIPAP